MHIARSSRTLAHLEQSEVSLPRPLAGLRKCATHGQAWLPIADQVQGMLLPAKGHARGQPPLVKQGRACKEIAGFLQEHTRHSIASRLSALARPDQASIQALSAETHCRYARSLSPT